MRNLNILLIALAVAGTCSVASGAVFTEDFESYAAGSALHGQGGWKGWDDTAGAGAPTSSSYAFSGSNSVEIVAGNLPRCSTFHRALPGRLSLSC